VTDSGPERKFDMILKYKFGTPIGTDAVTADLSCEKGLPQYGTVTADETGFRFEYMLADDEAVYGLGEALRGINKRGGLYESYNLDHSFHMEDVLSLYGSHNFLLLSGEKKIGLFFDYPAKLTFDIGYTRQDTLSVTCQEANLYLYVIAGDSLRDIVKQFRLMIGRSYIAPKWAMGFGQSRWGYKSPADFREVVDTHRKLHIPLDSVYMDIDYMERYKDFTVDQEVFPDFEAFVSEMRSKNIHLVPIIDAAIKIEPGYDVYEEGLGAGYFCAGEDGKPFQTAAWPGPTYLPDVLNTDAREWFGEKYRRLTNQGIDGFWNDMNEPSIFYTEQSMEDFRGTMSEFLASPTTDSIDDWFRVQWCSHTLSGPDNYKHFFHNMDGIRVCHEQVHNLYGYYMTRAAAEAFEKISPEKRLLLFSRSSYIGMHRYGGIWTGDNGSWWPHLLLNIQMMPSLNMCGFLFAGADLGGFGGDTTRDLLLRWLAFGVFTPLMRNHSSNNTREQECYHFEHPEDFVHIIGVRYRLLPYLYSEYVKAALDADMYFRPLVFDYPDDPMAKGTEDQLLLGDGVMVTPVYIQNASGRYVYLPEDMLFVKFKADSTLYLKNMKRGIHWIDVALNEVPMFVKKNHIVPVASFAETVCELDEENLSVIGWVTKPTVYTLYRDDGYTKDYERPSHYTLVTKMPD